MLLVQSLKAVTTPAWSTAFAVLLIVAGNGRANPGDQLLKLAPPEPGFAVLVQNLGNELDKWQQSPLAKWFWQSELQHKLADDNDRENWQLFTALLEAQFGVTTQQLIEDVFGNAILFCYTPASRDGKHAESGLILIAPRKPETLTQLIDNLNRLQTESGEIQSVKQLNYRNMSYTVRAHNEGHKEYYLFQQKVFAFSGQEAEIQKLIDRWAVDQSEKSKSLFNQFRQLGVEDAPMVWWFNPDLFEQEFAHKASTTADPVEKSVSEQLQRLMRSSNGLALTARTGSDLDITAVVGFRQPVTMADSRNQEQFRLSALPEPSLVGMTGRIQPAQLMKTAAHFLPGDAEAEIQNALKEVLGPLFGRSKVPSLVDRLGPNWLIWLTIPQEPKENEFVPQLAVAVQIRPQDNPETIAKSLSQGLDLGLGLLRIWYNQNTEDELELHESRLGPDQSVTVKYLSSKQEWPVGFQPGYAITNDFLILATNPEVVARLVAIDKSALQAKSPSSEPVFRFSGKESSRYLQRSGDQLAALLANSSDDTQELAALFAELAVWLEMIDQMQLSIDMKQDRLQVRMTTEFIQPLQGK